MSWIGNVLIGLDQFGNTLIGGRPDETISSWSGRSQGRLARWLKKGLGKLEDQHSVRSVEYTPWGTVDPHHMPGIHPWVASDWGFFMKATQVDNHLMPKTELDAAQRAALRLRYWRKDGRDAKWAERFDRDEQIRYSDLKAWKP